MNSMHNEVLKDFPYVVSKDSDTTYHSFKEISSVINIWNFDSLALEFWLTYDDTIKKELINKVGSVITSMAEEGLSESEIFFKLCDGIKVKLNHLDSIVTKENFNIMLDDYLLLLIEYQTINYYLRSINKLILDKDMIDPVTDQFLMEISNMVEFVNKPYRCDINIKLVYKAIWSLVEMGSYKRALKYAIILVNFFNRLEEVYLLSIDNLEEYYITNRFSIEHNKSYFVYKNIQSSRIVLSECYIGLGDIENAKSTYLEIVKLFNSKNIEGALKIPSWTATNRILESTIKLSKISENTDLDFIIDMFLNIRSRLTADNVTESVYESLLTIYMIKKEYF